MPSVIILQFSLSSYIYIYLFPLGISNNFYFALSEFLVIFLALQRITGYHRAAEDCKGLTSEFSRNTVPYFKNTGKLEYLIIATVNCIYCITSDGLLRLYVWEERCVE